MGPAEREVGVEDGGADDECLHLHELNKISCWALALKQHCTVLAS